jgi:N-formylmaleamate deformylase
VQLSADVTRSQPFAQALRRKARYRVAMRVCAAAVLAVPLWACGASAPAERTAVPREAASSDGEPFGAAKDFQPVAFRADVKGHGRPVIFIPGLGCPGLVWDETVAHLGEDYESHVLTLAGFAGNEAISEPLSAAVRRDLTRYIRSRRLRDPIVVGHSMGGFIAYWIASYHPELVGPVIVVDAGPALSGDLEEAKALRARWRYASDEEFAGGMRAAFSSMTSVPRKMAPVIEAVTRSDRRAIGNAIFEMVTTDLTDHVKDITAPVLIIAADGGLQGRIRAQIATIPDHEMIVLPRTRHFVMYDDPDGFFKAIDRFLEQHPAKPDPAKT